MFVHIFIGSLEGNWVLTAHVPGMCLESADKCIQCYQQQLDLNLAQICIIGVTGRILS